MNAIHKATEHARRPHRPTISAPQLDALRWLNDYGFEHVRDTEYWHRWIGFRKPPRGATAHKAAVAALEQVWCKVASTTVRALEHRGLVACVAVYDGVRKVSITDEGRDVVAVRATLEGEL